MFDEILIKYSWVVRLQVLLGFLALLTSCALAERIRPLTVTELQSVVVWNASLTSHFEVTGGTEYEYDVLVKNHGTHELASVTIALDTMADTRIYGESEPVKLTDFHNLDILHVGSVLPFNKAVVEHVKFFIPYRFKPLYLPTAPRIVAAEKYVGADLHDVGHLYTRLMSGRRPDLIPLFKAHPDLINVKDDEGNTATMLAFANTDAEVIKYVLSHGGNAKTRTRKGRTVMHFAALARYPGVLDLALTNGGRVNDLTVNGHTPLEIAITGGLDFNIDWLLDHGAILTKTRKGEPGTLQIAVREGSIHALDSFKNHGIDLRSHDYLGYGLMHYCVLNNSGMYDAVKAHGISVNDSNPKTGTTPLMIAAEYGKYQDVEWLIRNGANPNQKDHQGRTALSFTHTQNAQGEDTRYIYLSALRRAGISFGGKRSP